MIQDWLEVNVSVRPRFAGFLLFMMWIVSLAASTVFLGAGLAFAYSSLSSNCMWGLAPVNVTTVVQPQLQGRMMGATIRYSLRTRCFGVLDDSAMVQICRAEQVLNNRLNGICATVLISIHHVVCLMVIVGMSYTIIKVPHVIFDGGLVVVAFGVATIVSPLLVVYTEATEVSEVYEQSKGFVKQCKRSFRGRSMLGKFVVSFRPLRLHTAYPFFNIGKDTFLEFVSQALDFLIDMLAAGV